MLTNLLDLLLTREGKSVTVQVISRSYNDYGDATETVTTSTAVGFIIYGYRSSKYASEFGNIPANSVAFYSKSNIDTGDNIVFDGKTWKIHSRDKYENWYKYMLYEVV